MSRIEAQLLASKWVLTLQRHRAELAELEREITDWAERCGVVRPIDRTELAEIERRRWQDLRRKAGLWRRRSAGAA